MKKPNSVSIKSRILRLSLTGVAMALVAGGLITLFSLMGFDIFGGSDAAQLAAQRLAEHGYWIFAILILTYLAWAIFLNFIPGSVTFFVTLAFFLTGQNWWLTILIGATAVTASSITVYAIGRFGGRKLLFWLFGQSRIESRLDWFRARGTRIIPWLYIMPSMPGDLVSLACGASKFPFWKFVPIILICRPLKIAIAASYIPLFRILTSLTLGEQLTIALLVATNAYFILTRRRKP